MTAASESSSLGHLSETGAEGGGKKNKKRGKKKRRKDRRKQHAGKCSKEQHRQSDLSVLMTDDLDTEDAKCPDNHPISPLNSDPSVSVSSTKGPNIENQKSSEKSIVNCDEIVKDNEEEEDEDCDTNELEMLERLAEDASQDDDTMSTTPTSSTVIKDKETPSLSSAMSVSSAKMTPVSSSMSVEAEECLIKPSSSVSSSSTMSVTPDTVISAAHVTPDPSLPPEIVVKSPGSSDEEMEDLSRLVLCSAPSVPQPVVQSRRRPLLALSHLRHY